MKILEQKNLIIPLQFWFCKDIGLALPLVALNNTTISLRVKFKDFNDCWFNRHMKKEGNGTVSLPEEANLEVDVKLDPPTVNSASGYSSTSNKYQIKDIYLIGNLIFLDKDEKKKFTNFKLEYLIDQVQGPVQQSYNVRTETKSPEIDLKDIKHPVKNIIWYAKTDYSEKKNKVFCFDNILNCNFKETEYFEKTQIYCIEWQLMEKNNYDLIRNEYGTSAKTYDECSQISNDIINNIFKFPGENDKTLSIIENVELIINGCNRLDSKISNNYFIHNYIEAYLYNKQSHHLKNGIQQYSFL